MLFSDLLMSVCRVAATLFMNGSRVNYCNDSPPTIPTYEAEEEKEEDLQHRKFVKVSCTVSRNGCGGAGGRTTKRDRWWWWWF